MRYLSDNLRARGINAAYTITEMMVVAGIILLVAGMSLPMMAPLMRRAALRDASDIIKNACVQARSRAVQERVNFELIIISRATGAKREVSIQVRVEDWGSLPDGLPGSAEKEYKNRMAQRKILLPDKTKIVDTSDVDVTGTLVFTFTPTGTMETSVSLGADGEAFSIIDIRHAEMGKTIHMFTSTGRVTSKEKQS